MNTTDYQQLKQRLLEMQGAITARLDDTQGEERAQVQREGLRDNAHLWEESDIRDALDDEASGELRQINKALARMESGDYGICVSCNQAISNERLDAVPYADLCINCA